jgi:hypothetical protein
MTKFIGLPQVPTSSGWRYLGHFSQLLAYRLQNLPANGNQGPEKMSQTLVTNKKQGKNAPTGRREKYQANLAEH